MRRQQWLSAVLYNGSLHFVAGVRAYTAVERRIHNGSPANQEAKVPLCFFVSPTRPPLFGTTSTSSSMCSVSVFVRHALICRGFLLSFWLVVRLPVTSFPCHVGSLQMEHVDERARARQELGDPGGFAGEQRGAEPRPARAAAGDAGRAGRRQPGARALGSAPLSNGKSAIQSAAL